MPIFIVNCWKDKKAGNVQLKHCYNKCSLQQESFAALHLAVASRYVDFLIGPTPPLFLYFRSIPIQFTEIHRLQQNSNSDCLSTWRARWPLDNNHGPGKSFDTSHTLFKLFFNKISLWWRSQCFLIRKRSLRCYTCVQKSTTTPATKATAATTPRLSLSQQPNTMCNSRLQTTLWNKCLTIPLPNFLLSGKFKCDLWPIL